MKIRDCVDGLRERTLQVKGSYPRFCQETGIDYSWLSKFANGRLNPTQASLESLEKALDQWSAPAPIQQEVPTHAQT